VFFNEGNAAYLNAAKRKATSKEVGRGGSVASAASLLSSKSPRMRQRLFAETGGNL